MRVAVDRTKCLGSGNCVSWAPTVFDQSDDDFLVVLLDENPPAEQWTAVQQSARMCPAQAIAVESTDEEN